MNIAQREEVLKLASQTKKPTLLLVSIASGNACVDMTFSTDFLFLDRWWTPATEFQMQERGHRFVRYFVTYNFKSVNTFSGSIKRN